MISFVVMVLLGTFAATRLIGSSAASGIGLIERERHTHTHRGFSNLQDGRAGRERGLSKSRRRGCNWGADPLSLGRGISKEGNKTTNHRTKDELHWKTEKKKPQNTTLDLGTLQEPPRLLRETATGL